jgi:hypothetical protein
LGRIEKLCGVECPYFTTANKRGFVISAVSRIAPGCLRKSIASSIASSLEGLRKEKRRAEPGGVRDGPDLKNWKTNAGVQMEAD